MSGTEAPVEEGVCHTCRQPLDGEYVSLQGFHFHKDHFVCHGCSTPLGDKIHRRDDNVWCEGCFGKRFCELCHGCKEPILRGNMLKTGDKAYHQEHFACYKCKLPLLNRNAFLLNDQHYCEDHYMLLMAHRCCRCNLPITKQTDLLNVQGRMYHQDCVRCSYCDTALNAKQSGCTKDGQIYCQLDFQYLFSRYCTACGKYITGKALTVNDETYHPECMKCTVCRDPVSAYLCVRGSLRCTKHKDDHAKDETMCDVCHFPIAPSIRVLNAVGRKLHPTCFNCADCGRALNKPEARLRRDGALSCPQCLLKPRQAAKTGALASASRGMHAPSNSVAPVPSAGPPPADPRRAVDPRHRPSMSTMAAPMPLSPRTSAPPPPPSFPALHHPPAVATPSPPPPPPDSPGLTDSGQLGGEDTARVATGRVVARSNNGGGGSQRSVYITLPSRSASAIADSLDSVRSEPNSPEVSAPVTKSRSDAVGLGGGGGGDSNSNSNSGASTPSYSSSRAVSGAAEAPAAPGTPVSYTAKRKRKPIYRPVSTTRTQHSQSDADLIRPSTPTSTMGSTGGSTQGGSGGSGGGRQGSRPTTPTSMSDTVRSTASVTSFSWAPENTDKETQIEWQKGSLIGVGSFGKVYMAMNVRTGELIAVKQMSFERDSDLEKAYALQSEIDLMKNLRHPNIIAFLGTERQPRLLNILMEYVPGNSLDALLDKLGPFTEHVIRNYTFQLLQALAYCHSKHVIHRDIKGKNILVDTRGNLKLADFGSAKRFTDAMGKDAPSLSYNYTPLWTAPEVLMGNYDAKVDIWSLGCVLIEMASAQTPWAEEKFENPFRALYHIGNSNSIPKIPDKLSPLAKDFLLKCLTRDPDKRPDAQTLLNHEWIRELSLSSPHADHFAYPPASLASHAGSTPSTQASPSLHPEPSPSHRHSKSSVPFASPGQASLPSDSLLLPETGQLPPPLDEVKHTPPPQAARQLSLVPESNEDDTASTSSSSTGSSPPPPAEPSPAGTGTSSVTTPTAAAGENKTPNGGPLPVPANTIRLVPSPRGHSLPAAAAAAASVSSPRRFIFPSAPTASSSPSSTSSSSSSSSHAAPRAHPHPVGGHHTPQNSQSGLASVQILSLLSPRGRPEPPPSHHRAQSNAVHVDAPQLNLQALSLLTEPADLEVSSGDNGEKYYPYHMLKSGTEVPDGVDASNRELYLAPSTFQKLFKMSKAEYTALKDWRKKTLKRELALW